MNRPTYPDPDEGDWRDTAVKIGFGLLIAAALIGRMLS